MKVHELITILSGCDQNATVITESGLFDPDILCEAVCIVETKEYGCNGEEYVDMAITGTHITRTQWVKGITPTSAVYIS